MDIGSAFTYMFDDEEWIKKLAIGGALFFVAMILMPLFFVGIALLLPIMGYTLQVLKNVRDGHPRPLPEWTDFGNLFQQGLFFFLIALVYNIPGILISCLSAVAQIGMAEANSDMQSVIAMLSFCLSCLQFLLSIAAGFLLPAGIIRYAQYGTFGSAFQFGEMFSFISSNIGEYVIVFLVNWVAGLLAAFGLILCFVGVFFTIFWSYLVTGNLYGQLARRMQGAATA